MRIISYLILIVIMFIGLTFASLNPNLVEFHYYFGSTKIALSMLLVIVLGIGMFLGLFVSLLSLLKAKKANLLLKFRLKSLEKEVENLRALPLKND